MAVAADAPRVALRTLGCKVNRAESESLAESLRSLGVAVGEDPGPTGTIVVNTCTVTAEADAKARKEVRRALAATQGTVVVTGCLAALEAEMLRALGDRVVVVCDRESLRATVAGIVGVGDASGGKQLATVFGTASGACGTFRTRALVKVQDGCDNRCAYCIVPDARGLSRSVAAAEILRRVEALCVAGTAEIVLTGVNLGRYTDGAAAPDLAALIELLAKTGIARIRLSSIEPPDLTERFLRVLGRTAAVAPHLHVPLQSGSDRTLSRMGRRYDTRAYADALARARAALPGVAVTTDVIAGFPGETDADAADSLAFVARCGFAKLHVFRYSKRAGTPAASTDGQVAAPVKAERARALRELGGALETAYAAGRDGQGADLLVEAVREGVAHGTTGDHLRVTVCYPDAHAGDLVPVRLGLDDDGSLRGYYVEETRARV
ncbi:MAG TPA: MiaB/RimO family radical SAM methylthiotransferase [Coriobacteriia bacterium]